MTLVVSPFIVVRVVPPSAPPDQTARKLWFVWPAFFALEKGPQTIDMAEYVPGYINGTTQITLERQPDPLAIPLPTNIVWNGRTLAYDGSGRSSAIVNGALGGYVAWGWGPFRLVTTNPTWRSNQFNVTLSYDLAAGAAGPAGPGVASAWAHGTSGTFNTLTSVKNSINATTGGFSELPNTALFPHMLNRAGDWATPTTAQLLSSKTGYKSLSPAFTLVGGGGPTNIYDIWATAAFDGKAIMFGTVGGHYAAWINNLYRVRLTDPPAADVVHHGYPTGAVTRRSNTPAINHQFIAPQEYNSYNTSSETNSNSPVWGPRATHQYYAMVRIKGTNRYLVGGSNQWYSIDNPLSTTDPNAAGVAFNMAWELDLDAANMREAWTPLNTDQFHLPIYKNAPFGCVVYLPLENGDVIFNAAGANLRYRAAQRDVVVETTALENYPGHPSAGSRLSYIAAWRHQNKTYAVTTANSSPGTLPGMLLNATDNQEKFVLPAWWTTSAYDATGGLVFIGNKVIGANVTSGNNFFCGDLTTGVVQQLTGLDTLGQTGQAGLYSKIVAVPQAQCFVFAHTPTRNLIVFRPPSAWAIDWAAPVGGQQ